MRKTLRLSAIAITAAASAGHAGVGTSPIVSDGVGTSPIVSDGVGTSPGPFNG